MAFRILTVCTANVCRSPLAEGLLRARLPAEAFIVESAGIRTPPEGRTDPHVVQILNRRGIAVGRLASRQLTGAIAEQSDLVLTATREHRGAVLELHPGALRRTFTLLEFAALAAMAEADSPAALVRAAAASRSQGPKETDIADPIGRSDSFHEQVAEQIDKTVAAIASRLAP